MSRGSAYNDWNLLESGNLVHEIIYSRGNVACVFLVQQCKLLQKFMEIFPLIPDIGWEKAFEKNFCMSVEEFYIQFQEFVVVFLRKGVPNMPSLISCSLI